MRLYKTFYIFTQGSLKNSENYYPFGMEMAGRGFSGSYRFGYQGSEKDNEVSGEGNSYTTEFRQLDPRLGRWFSVDPVFQPWQSPYTSMDNNPICGTDKNGKFWFLVGAVGGAIVGFTADIVGQTAGQITANLIAGKPIFSDFKLDVGDALISAGEGAIIGTGFGAPFAPLVTRAGNILKGVTDAKINFTGEGSVLEFKLAGVNKAAPDVMRDIVLGGIGNAAGDVFKGISTAFNKTLSVSGAAFLRSESKTAKEIWLKFEKSFGKKTFKEVAKDGNEEEVEEVNPAILKEEQTNTSDNTVGGTGNGSGNGGSSNTGANAGNNTSATPSKIINPKGEEMVAEEGAEYEYFGENQTRTRCTDGLMHPVVPGSVRGYWKGEVFYAAQFEQGSEGQATGTYHETYRTR